MAIEIVEIPIADLDKKEELLGDGKVTNVLIVPGVKNVYTIEVKGAPKKK